jgi:hypothetical protein
MNTINANLNWLLSHFLDRAERDALLQGIRLERLGDLAREHGIQRWKRTPAGTGRNLNIVSLSLHANGLALYSHDGVRATGTNGDLMTKPVLAQLHADDFVIALDLAHPTARSIADGTAGLTHEPISPDALETYHQDKIRAANSNDVDRVVCQLILPRLRRETEA